jgi:hypothetical protein
MNRTAPEVFMIVMLARLIGVTLAVVLVALALWIIPAHAADRPFDWDRYLASQDACREADRIAQDCQPGPAGFRNFCNELSLREAKRKCSAFGPSGERQP